MLSREDFYMIKQMRQQGAYIVDIATQIGCSERTVRRYLKYPEPPARKTRHKSWQPHNDCFLSLWMLNGTKEAFLPAKKR